MVGLRALVVGGALFAGCSFDLPGVGVPGGDDLGVSSGDLAEAPDLAGPPRDLQVSGSDAASAPDAAGAAGFTQVPSGATMTLESVWGTGAQNVFAVGAAATITHWDGGKWSLQQSPQGVTQSLNAVWAVPGTSDVYAAGNGERIVHTSNGGAAWDSPSVGGSGGKNLFGLWGSSASAIAAVGQIAMGMSATIAYYDGTNWQQLTLNTGGHDLYASWGSSSVDSFAVGQGGIVMHGNGVSYSGALPTTKGLRSIWGSGVLDVYIVGDSGTILHSSDDGVSWKSQDPGVSVNLLGVWGSSASDVWIVGQAVGNSPLILHSDGSGTWTRSPTPANLNDDLHAVWGTGPSDVWAVGQGGVILHGGN